jgi:hypothetical protein
MSPLVASLLLAIEIHATGTCPDAADVERKLAPLLAAGTAARLPDVATLSRGADGTLRLTLDDPAGRAIGERRFPPAGTCGDQAETAAVTLAIWEAQLHPEIALRLDRLSAPAPALPAATVRETPAGPRPPLALSVGVGGGGGWHPGSWAPVGRIELALGRAGSRWRARLALLGVGRHALNVAPGQARWWRVAGSLGADYDVVRGERWALALGAGALGGVATISGAGYSLDRTTRSADTGGELRLRVEWRPGVVRPWLGVSLVGWLRRQTLELAGVTDTSALPRVEPMAAVGADFVW